jgi:glycosyltransferase involved in cell wall biosynthesis
MIAQRHEAQQLPNLQLIREQLQAGMDGRARGRLGARRRVVARIGIEYLSESFILNGYVHGALPWRAPLLVAGHSCVLSWWQEVKGEAAPNSWNRYRDAVRCGLQSADVVVAPTQAMLDMLCRHYGELPSTRVVPNGRDQTLFDPATKKPYILSAGRLWDEAKNLAALDAVAPQLDWPIYVAGDAQRPRDAQGAASEATQSLQVRALGKLPQNELRHWMAEAAVYALPARYEPFGLSALEAALSGCALVLGDIASLREVWQDAALFVPPNDHEALTARLQFLIADEHQRNAMSQRARDRAREFSATRMATNHLQIYTQLQDCSAAHNRLPLSA